MWYYTTMENHINADIVKTTLKNGDFTCVISDCNEIIFTSIKRGVEPLIDFIHYKTDSDNLMLADKVIGKAAALLCIKAGFSYVYTDVISTPAKQILSDNSIQCEYRTEVLVIQNRAKTGLCPMEGLSQGVSNPEAMYEKVKLWLKSK